MSDKTKTSASDDNPGAPSTDSVWKAMPPMTMNVSMSVAVDGPIWVIKVQGGYVRVPQTGGRSFAVRRLRMATRFDSPVWAHTVCAAIANGKVVRLWTKSEREAEKARKQGAETYKWVGEYASGGSGARVK